MEKVTIAVIGLGELPSYTPDCTHTVVFVHD